MTNLRDDWFSLVVGSPHEHDPLVSCVFKTEFVTRLKNALRGSLDVRIGPTIEYAKKPGKMAIVKCVKDPAVPRDDVYKSSTIHVGPGEDPASGSKPTPKGIPVKAKPITAGKLLRPGGPGGRKSSYVPKATPKPQPLPGQGQVRQVVAPAAVVQPVVAVQGHSRQQSSQSLPRDMLNAQIQGVKKLRPVAAATPAVAAVTTVRTTRTPPPPPPPPPPVQTEEPTHRALYDYTGQSAGELSITKDELILVVQKEGNG